MTDPVQNFHSQSSNIKHQTEHTAWSTYSLAKKQYLMADQIADHLSRDSSQDVLPLQKIFDAGYEGTNYTLESGAWHVPVPFCRRFEFSLFLNKAEALQKRLSKQSGEELPLEQVPRRCFERFLQDQLRPENCPELCDPEDPAKNAHFSEKGIRVMVDLILEKDPAPTHLLFYAVDILYQREFPGKAVKALYEI